MIEQIRGIVAKHGGLGVDVATLDDKSDLYEAGMTSFASVDLMLGLEEAFDIEFITSFQRRDDRRYDAGKRGGKGTHEVIEDGRRRRDERSGREWPSLRP